MDRISLRCQGGTRRPQWSSVAARQFQPLYQRRRASCLHLRNRFARQLALTEPGRRTTHPMLPHCGGRRCPCAVSPAVCDLVRATVDICAPHVLTTSRVSNPRLLRESPNVTSVCAKAHVPVKRQRQNAGGVSQIRIRRLEASYDRPPPSPADPGGSLNTIANPRGIRSCR